jgi:hypothetical protein
MILAFQRDFPFFIQSGFFYTVPTSEVYGVSVRLNKDITALPVEFIPTSLT